MADTLPSQEVLLALLDYDPETGLLTWKHRPGGPRDWNTRWAGKPALNCINSAGYRVGAILGQFVHAHRVIWKMIHGWLPDEIDHDDGDGSNNRLPNLIPSNHAGNMRNRRLNSNNKSGVNGVYFDRDRHQWAVEINGKHLGRFSTREEARAARKQADMEHGYSKRHGDPLTKKD